jgi:hypothetical protein
MATKGHKSKWNTVVQAGIMAGVGVALTGLSLLIQVGVHWLSSCTSTKPSFIDRIRDWLGW